MVRRSSRVSAICLEDSTPPRPRWKYEYATNSTTPSSRKCSRGSRSQRFSFERNDWRSRDCSVAGCASATKNTSFTNCLQTKTADHRFRFLRRRHLFTFESRTDEKSAKDRMHHNCRPQQHPSQFSTDADICKVQHGERAIRQHSVQRLGGRVGGPAGDAHADQGDAGDAAHYYAGTSKLRAKQQTNHDWRPSEQKQPRTCLCGCRQCENVFLHPDEVCVIAVPPLRGSDVVPTWTAGLRPRLTQMSPLRGFWLYISIFTLASAF